MSSNITRLKFALWGLFLAAAPIVFAREPTPTPKGPEPELHGGFIFSSTRKDGSVEWKVQGNSATFLKPNLIELKDVRAIYLAEDGTNTVATTEKALLDKEEHHIKTDDFVTIVTQNSVITGTGFEWDQEKKKGSLKSDVKVVYKQPEGKGLLQ